MARNIVFRIIAGLVLLAAIAGIAYFAYTAGTASNVQLPAPQGNEANPYLFHGYGWHMFPFGFGCFVPLAVLFLVCLAFCAMRRMVWGPRWGWHHMHRHGPWMDKDSGECVPPMVSDWHRRMHEAPTEEKPCSGKPDEK